MTTCILFIDFNRKREKLFILKRDHERTKNLLVLASLHRLSVKHRTEFKVLMLAFKPQHATPCPFCYIQYLKAFELAVFNHIMFTKDTQR